MNKKLLLVITVAIIIGLGWYLWRVGGKFQGIASGVNPSPSSSKIHVVTSFYPLYFFAQAIGGDRADVVNITPAGAEPHDYEPSAQDAALMENSRLLILNGGGLEPWGDDIKQNLDSERTLIITAGEGLATQKLVEEGQEIIDPHVWLSPPLAAQMVDKITAGFIKIDPASGAYYQAQADTLKTRLSDLDNEYRRGLSNCANHDIITSHAAFGYLAAAYGLNQVPLAGLSPDIEPSSQQLAAIADWAKKNNIKYIFFESLASPKLAETLATEVGAKTLVLNPLEGLSADELAAGQNYFSVMENNLANLKIALVCP